MPNQSLSTRLKGAWNAFFNKDPTYREVKEEWYNNGWYYNSSFRPDRPHLGKTSERTIVTAIYNRIAMDVAAVDIIHARLDDDGRYIETIDSDLNNCLTVEANIDQTGRAFIQDVTMSMLDEGSVAIVPIDTTANPFRTGSYDIISMRTGRVVDWKAQYVRIEVYDEITGNRREITLPKRLVSIVESPLYSVMNDPNSVLQRLLRKLRLLDFIDEQQASSKLNLIIQLPYIIKTESRRNQAEVRRKSIEDQLVNNPYGIAYTDGTERITQLSRPLENNLLAQVEYLTKMLYNQLGITDEIMNGTADEKAMTNYYSRTIEPIVSAITDEMKRKFLTKTARTQGQSIEFFRDPFRLVPISDIAEIADRFTRNEILSSNEVRQIIGRKPSQDPTADELRNKNLYPVDVDGDGVPDEYSETPEGEESEVDEESFEEDVNELEDLNKQLDELEESLKHYASPYYDPVKAHEYYMKNRKLKGRTSTASLNDKGKAAASYVKTNINAERDRKISARRDLKTNRLDTYRSVNQTRQDQLTTQRKKQADSIRKEQKMKVDSQREKSKSAISRLSDRIKQMSKADKNGSAGLAIRNEIARLRDENKSIIASIRGEATSKRNSYNEKIKTERTKARAVKSKSYDTERKSYTKDVKAYRKEATDKYANELQKMRRDRNLIKVKKKK